MVALLIIGVIATFTIPKIITSGQDQQKKAVFKETISMLQVFLSQGITDGTLTNATNEVTMRAALSKNLNFLSVINNNTVPNACWGSASIIRDYYALLANGACVAPYQPRWDPSGEETYMIAIDWNGAAGPNIVGDDWLLLCLGVGNSSSNMCNTTVRKGEIKIAWNAYGGNSQALYDSLW